MGQDKKKINEGQGKGGGSRKKGNIFKLEK